MIPSDKLVLIGEALESDSRPRPTEVQSAPDGWFVLDVMRREARKWDWVALMVDVDPDDLKNCVCDFPALLYVHPKEYHPGRRTASQCFVRIPGKHRNYDAACDALEAMIAIRH